MSRDTASAISVGTKTPSPSYSASRSCATARPTPTPSTTYRVRPAHAEAGWFSGQGKKVYVLITDKDSFEPELMYKLFTKVCISLEELVETIR